MQTWASAERKLPHDGSSKALNDCILIPCDQSKKLRATLLMTACVWVTLTIPLHLLWIFLRFAFCGRNQVVQVIMSEAQSHAQSGGEVADGGEGAANQLPIGVLLRVTGESNYPRSAPRYHTGTFTSSKGRKGIRWQRSAHSSMA